ncbi:DUF6387 family protein [Yersinia enterocolitica]|uniref:DUF6387 family protein n=1 Tax=Yersinia sp. 2540 StPb PI TaxID=3117406 RepID=UPI000B41507D|nr:hypothetical protein CBW53_00075 [Yersinia frederiksenii]HDL6639103.1 hypothetical protein [Yersinia enterocolitica]HDL6659387.1 hypothetical protein [Yersinia enterocolitica]HDL6665285.1 hypothetical protein [Yersinia enterocolitica]HDL6712013.1 hypothetical protein [Yersinia enterocolitica]
MRINKKSQLPSYFDADKYKAFSVLDDESLLQQLVKRLDIKSDYEMYDIEDINNILMEPVILEPNALHTLKDHKMKVESELLGPRLSSYVGVRPMELVTAFHLYKRCKEFSDSIDNNSELSFFSKFWMKQRHINTIPQEILDNDGSIYVEIDLELDDKLIIDSLSRLIPEWRKEMGVLVSEEPVNSSWAVSRAKILDYKIIPLFDLLAWSEKTNNSITNGVLAVTLFPDGEYDSINIAQTIKPFLDKIFNFSSIEKFKREIS